MKTKLTIFLMGILLAASSAFAQVEYTSWGLQVGRTTYTPIGWGYYTSGGTNYSMWAMEHYQNGMNLWKPWPAYNNGNYFIHVKDSTGNVGIGKIATTTGAKLDVNGGVAASGVLLTSDARLKTNIKSLSNCMDNLMKLNGKSYIKHLAKSPSYIGDPKDSIKFKTIQSDNNKPDVTSSEFGFLAQELREVFPELVSEGSDGYLSVNYIALIPVIVEALKDQKNTIQAQSDKIKELEAVNKTGNLRVGASATSSTIPSSTTSVSSAFLYDNTPNPFRLSTEIGYFIPESVKASTLFIFDMQGLMIKSYSIDKSGKGSVTINGSELKPGMYIYSLVADGKEVDTKRMIMTE